jgi:hypothetical protein
LSPTACFVTASGQNVFFGELLDALADALADAGVVVERAVDRFPPLRDDLVYVFVPHELLPLIEADAHPSEAQLRRSVAVCTEQPGTGWFDQDADIAARSGAAVDINPVGVRELKRRGVAARVLPFGYVPAWDHWGGDPDHARPVDLTFLGGYTPRRAEALARCAPALRGRRTSLRLVETTHPHLANSRYFLSGERKWDALAETRLILNVHRSELGYFEWHRVIGAMLNGCVVLSEHSLGYEPLVPGEHLVGVSFDSLEFALAELLDHEDQLERLRDRAYRFLREELPLSNGITVLAEAVEAVAAEPVPAVYLGRRDPPPRPRPVPTAPPEYEQVLSRTGDLDVVRAALKQLLLEQRELRRGLNQVLQGGGSLAQDTVRRFGPQRGGAPRVSVILTVFNYAGFVTGAIDSVAAGDLADVELVIVDDASTDGSGACIDRALRACPWLRATVITRGSNGGLPAARNLGLEHARGDYVFILDADNEVLPGGLTRLAEALDEAPEAGFAYGIIQQFGPGGPVGVMNWLGWDARRLRYGNFIDAMSMMRRSVLVDAGGYTTDTRLHGWEDFDLWCKLADRGIGAVSVPEFVARYRVGLHSMIALTNIDVSAAWSVLVEHHPSLSDELAEAPS